MRKRWGGLDVLLLQQRYAWGQMPAALADLGWLTAALLRWGSVWGWAAHHQALLLLMAVQVLSCLLFPLANCCCCHLLHSISNRCCLDARPHAGIYDDRRYRHAAPGPAVRRRTTSGGGASSAAAAPALAPLSAPPALAPVRATANGRAAGARARQRRPRRKPRHLSAEFADDASDIDDMDAEMAEAELREADEDEEEWQRRLKREQHDVDCVCGVSYDDGEGERPQEGSWSECGPGCSECN